MDAQAMLKAALVEAVPFVKHLGVEMLDTSDGAAQCRLKLDDRVKNHLGTLHAGAMYTLAETASGMAMATIFADKMFTLKPVAAGAEVQYLKLAKGDVTAKAEAKDSPDQLRSQLEADGKVRLDVAVSLYDESGREVAKMTFDWAVRG